MSIAFPMEETRIIEQPIKKRISIRRLRANRANARKSTGPRTVKGKQRASRNACKHLCTWETVLESECEATYHTHKAEIFGQLRPHTIPQMIMADHIVNLYWKLMRFPHAERELYKIEQDKVAKGSGRSWRMHGELHPCQTLARRMSDDKSNGFILLSRQERSLENMLLRWLKRYDLEKKHNNVSPDDMNRQEIREWDRSKERKEYLRQMEEQAKIEAEKQVEPEKRTQIEANENAIPESETAISPPSSAIENTKRTQDESKERPGFPPGYFPEPGSFYEKWKLWRKRGTTNGGREA